MTNIQVWLPLRDPPVVERYELSMESSHDEYQELQSVRLGPRNTQIVADLSSQYVVNLGVSRDR